MVEASAVVASKLAPHVDAVLGTGAGARGTLLFAAAAPLCHRGFHPHVVEEPSFQPNDLDGVRFVEVLANPGRVLAESLLVLGQVAAPSGLEGRLASQGALVVKLNLEKRSSNVAASQVFWY